MATRECYGEQVEVYEITAPSQVKVYEEALDVVRDHSEQTYFQIDTYPNPDAEGYIGILRVHIT